LLSSFRWEIAHTTSEQVAIADAIAEKLAGRVGRPGNSENNSFIDSGLLMRSAIHSVRAAKLTRHWRF
jgi:hypothetical protein